MKTKAHSNWRKVEVQSRLAVWLFLLLCSTRIATADSFKQISLNEAGRWRPGSIKTGALDSAQPARPFPDVELGPGGGLQFPCSFKSTGAVRLWWDCPVSLDLSDMHSMEISLSCKKPDAIKSFAFYLKSGEGWYVWIAPVRYSGRQLFSFQIEKAGIEGKPAGWNSISGMRVAFNSGKNEDIEIILRSLSAQASSVVVIEGTGSSSCEAEKGAARSAARRVSYWLSAASVPHALLSDGSVNERKLRHARVAILPYNDAPPKPVLKALRAMIGRGDKAIVCYSSSKELAGLMGVRLGEYKAEKRPSQWSSFSFTRNAPARLPEFVYQNSRNIRPAYPDGKGSRIIAFWNDAEGGRSEDPAWVQSERGFWMSHILLDGDERAKIKLLAGLVGSCHEQLWQAMARGSLDGAGRIGEFRDISEAIAGIEKRLKTTRHSGSAEARLAEARSLSYQMRRAWGAGDYPSVVDLYYQLSDALLEAYASARQPESSEFRGVWDHSGSGLFPGDWDRTCALLSSNGINAVFPNVLWPGQAHYPSSVAPASFSARINGDQLAACVEAASKYGIQVHAWKICWCLDKADEAWVKSLREQGRLQQSSSGKMVNWLCPSHPSNVALELEAVSELLRSYKLDGIHLDYVRFPHADTCFCQGCRSRFEQFRGQKTKGWPDCVVSGRLRREYLAWRSAQITAFVRAVKETASRIAPDVKVSAAVYPSFPSCVTVVGQDWRSWLTAGYLDFVCPMNYSSDAASFKELITTQLALGLEPSRVMPGIGVTSAESRLTADRVIDQIEALRSYRLGGFILFKLDVVLEKDILPLLYLGVMASGQQR